ncbi:MAG: START domain-containing protein [Bacteroidales bacterium]|nr:START domain-containing protein [Bacteroidales bacterium]
MKKLLTIFLCLLLTASIYSQGEWEIRKEEDGIKVYTRKVEGSKIQEFKAIAIMDAKLSSVIAVMKDVNNYPDFLKNLVETRLLEANDTFQMHYLINKTPWPVTDRDGIFSSVFSQYYDTKLVKMTVKFEKDYVLENDKCVRMEDATGFWLFDPLETNKVEVTYQMHIDPGGNIPSWVLNMFIVDAPIKDLKAIRERVKLEKYENIKYDFLIDY